MTDSENNCKTLDQAFQSFIQNDILRDKKLVNNIVTMNEHDIEAIAFNYKTLPFKIMKRSEIYDFRFDSQGLYNSNFIKNEIKIIETQEAGIKWLFGERLEYILTNELYTSYGYDSFNDYVKAEVSLDLNTVEIYINIYRKFSFDDVLRLRSKVLSLAQVNILD